MRMSCSLFIAGALLLPLQAAGQSGSVGNSGGGTAGVTTGTGTGATGAPNVGMPGPPGVNSAGTAQSSGGRTTGAASGSTAEDEKIRAEDPKIDKKIKSICKGC
jgi:hypothetical protein